jgi:capsular polysaccharide biosynthesis protein
VSIEPTAHSPRSPRLWSPELAVVESEPDGLHLTPAFLTRMAGLVAIMMLVGAAAGYLVSSLAPTVHGARSEIVYHLESTQSADFLRTDRQHTTQLVLIKSRAVLAPVAASAHLSFDELSHKVSASMVDDSEVIRIQVDDGSATRAKSLATAISSRYLDLARRNAGDGTSTIDHEISEVDAQRQDVEDEISRLEQRRFLASLDGDKVPAPSDHERSLNKELNDLLDQRQQLVSQQNDQSIRRVDAPTIERVDAPYVLQDPVSPRPGRAALLGAVAALLVAVLLVAFLTRREIRARSGL